MNHLFELGDAQYGIVHRASNSCRIKYGMGRVEPVTLAVLALDLAKRMSMLDLPPRLHRAAMHVKGLTQATGEETKQSQHGSISVPTECVTEMARVWYSQVDLGNALTLKELVLVFFHLWSEEITLQRLHEARSARRRRVPFADAGVYSETWSGESVFASAEGGF